MGFAKLLIAWAFSMAVFAVMIQAWDAAKGTGTSGFAKGVVDGFIGLGVLLAVPTFLFALVIGWPVMSWLAQMRPAWLIPLLAMPVLALAMWGLTKIMLPDGWLGAGQALVGYAMVLGLVWGCLTVAPVPGR